MQTTTQSASSVIERPSGQGWGDKFAEQVDQEIRATAADRDVISVSVTPIVASAQTIALMVTVVYREERPGVTGRSV